MSKKNIFNAFGKCYNNKDFSHLYSLLESEIVYESFDCLYRVTSQKDVTKVLDESVMQNTSAYSGYYLRKGMLFRHLTECVLICDDAALGCIRIVGIKTKRGKIANITGYDPSKHEFTRGKKIDG